MTNIHLYFTNTLIVKIEANYLKINLTEVEHCPESINIRPVNTAKHVIDNFSLMKNSNGNNYLAMLYSDDK